ncbi:hypothetical protein ARMSODRAFT_633664 [Armillaria solidipes]|uniref:Uncharacterized protein n=1 Tax=Armillaria solidipes TaxID=1076256 RepID=A0A2H3BRA9_9AGAR|nr:hypothetical protein ARMSODRAFT_633664 [Armillaria solidipes]
MSEYFSSPCHDASSALSTIVTSLVIPSFTIAQGCVVGTLARVLCLDYISHITSCRVK